MAKERTGFGVGFGKTEPPRTIYEDYIGKLIITNNSDGKSIVGVLQKIDKENNVAVFSPFMGYKGDDSAYVNKEPAILALPLTAIYPGQFDLGEYVAGYNKKLEQRSPK
ncbi:MAG: hypothetical protein WC438_00395 [Candidatus Pacearchaeota archaeon]